MATVFYREGTGEIYGVHPSGTPVKGGVPADVLSLEIAGVTPDRVQWPGGCEHRSAVVDGALVVRGGPETCPCAMREARAEVSAALDRALKPGAKPAEIQEGLAAVRKHLGV